MQYTTTTTVLHNAHITSARNDQVYPFFILLIYNTFIGPTTVQTIIGPTNQITVRLQKTHKIYTYSRKYCLQSVSTLLYQGLTSTTCIYIYIYIYTYVHKEMEKTIIYMEKQLTCIRNLHEQSPKEMKTNNKRKIVTNVSNYTDIFYT